MSQFEYTDINKFYVSTGVFLIGLTFFLPWLFFRESFDLLIKTEDLHKYTEVARKIIYQRQHFLSYFPTFILLIALLTFSLGIYYFVKGIRGWIRKDKEKQIAEQVSNQMATNEAKVSSPQEIQTKEVTISTKEGMILLAKIPINNVWILNHWGSNCASIKNGKMIFEGKTRLDSDGSHINLNNILTFNSVYQISCFVKCLPGTTGMFQLWCHDNIGLEPHGSSNAVPYTIPDTGGQICTLRFTAWCNTHLRIHLQYKPGEGQIEVSEVKISEIIIS